MFESISGFFSNVGGFFKSGYNYVHDKVSSMIDGVSTTVTKVVNAPVEIVKTIYADTGKVLNGIKDTAVTVITGGQNAVRDVITHGEDRFADAGKGIAQSLSLPLVIGAGGFLLFMLSKK